jgi:exodeoxyribonuclease-3
MFRVVTVNANGLRSAAAKGLLRWLRRIAPDIVCVQEVKAQEPDLPAELLRPEGWHAHFHFAATRGYSGTAVFSRTAPRATRIGFGDPEFDAEGRTVEADFGSILVLSTYFPSGSSSPLRQEAKFRFLERYALHLAALRAAGREVLLCGDVNIAHRAIDIRNWKSNQKNSGFLPEERAWLDRLFEGGPGGEGWVDVFRSLDARPDQYTWWSSRGAARENNVGWRIDYQIATPGLAARAEKTRIYTGERFSDHAPLIVDYSGCL